MGNLYQFDVYDVNGRQKRSFVVGVLGGVELATCEARHRFERDKESDGDKIDLASCHIFDGPKYKI